MPEQMACLSLKGTPSSRAPWDSLLSSSTCSQPWMDLPTALTATSGSCWVGGRVSSPSLQSSDGVGVGLQLANALTLWGQGHHPGWQALLPLHPPTSEPVKLGSTESQAIPLDAPKGSQLCGSSLCPVQTPRCPSPQGAPALSWDKTPSLLALSLYELLRLQNPGRVWLVALQ